MTDHDMPEDVPQERAQHILSTMMKIRFFEERAEELFLAGRIPGFVHLYIGQEAIAASTCAALRRDDYITSTHRGHGHAIAKGMALTALMAELYGKETGACRGRGGSMHVADFSLGMLGANGIVGGGFGIAAGAALSAVHRRSGQVAVCFFGDGAINKGTFHEALNFAALRNLPVVYVCENNQYAQFTASHRTTSVEDLSIRASAYGITGETVDGNDAAAVFVAATRAVDRARQGAGPTLLNMVTYRYGGHYVGDAEVYREEEDTERWRQRDPVERFVNKMTAAAMLTDQGRSEIEGSIREEIDAAVAFAEDSPYPDPDGALEYVYTEKVRP